MSECKWQMIDSATDRMLVPGGWLYRCWTPEDTAAALAFVPDPGTLPALLLAAQRIVSEGLVFEEDEAFEELEAAIAKAEECP